MHPIVATIDASIIGSIKSGLPPENASRVTKKIEPRILIGPPLYMVQNGITGIFCFWMHKKYVYVCDHSYSHRLPINEIQYNLVRDWVRQFGGYWNFIFGLPNFEQFTVKNWLFSGLKHLFLKI